jgi:hypothetical protein
MPPQSVRSGCPAASRSRLSAKCVAASGALSRWASKYTSTRSEGRAPVRRVIASRSRARSAAKLGPATSVPKPRRGGRLESRGSTQPPFMLAIATRDRSSAARSESRGIARTSSGLNQISAPGSVRLAPQSVRSVLRKSQ